MHKDPPRLRRENTRLRNGCSWNTNAECYHGLGMKALVSEAGKNVDAFVVLLGCAVTACSQNTEGIMVLAGMLR